MHGRCASYHQATCLQTALAGTHTAALGLHAPHPGMSTGEKPKQGPHRPYRLRFRGGLWEELRARPLQVTDPRSNCSSAVGSLCDPEQGTLPL